MTEVRAVTDLLGPVEVRVPADATMARVLRLAASGVASLRGFDLEEIDDIKLAVSEVFIALVEHGTGHPVVVRFVSEPDAFIVNGATEVDGAFDIQHPDLRLCRVVLTGVCASHDIDVVDGAVTITATLRRPFNGV